MQTVIEIKWGDKDISVFAEKLSVSQMAFTSLHRHRYAEIHVITAGTAVYTVENEEYEISARTALLIPPRAFHSLSPKRENTKFIAFQIDADCADVLYSQLSERIFDSFLELTEKSGAEDTEKAVPYIYWLMSELFSHVPLTVKRNEDYLYLIFEFITKHYNEDVKLCHLAQELHLSEKQTQRIIKSETGNTFLKELTAQRMKIAEYLNKTTEMTLNEISVYVGYGSYSGFWKAWQRYKEEK